MALAACIKTQIKRQMPGDGLRKNPSANQEVGTLGGSIDDFGRILFVELQITGPSLVFYTRSVFAALTGIAFRVRDSLVDIFNGGKSSFYQSDFCNSEPNLMNKGGGTS